MLSAVFLASAGVFPPTAIILYWIESAWLVLPIKRMMLRVLSALFSTGPTVEPTAIESSLLAISVGKMVLAAGTPAY